MPRQSSESPNDMRLRERALSRWENEGGTVSAIHALPTSSNQNAATPDLTNAELVELRVRVIALENLIIALLSTAPDQQVEFVREMAGYIAPRPGFTPHPLTTQAAAHMIDLVERSSRFRGAGSR